MKKIGIGYENYKDFVDDSVYYVDKTLLVRDIVKEGGKVTLFTRPRRFGKTLALSMLQTFFEEERDFDGRIIDKMPYFKGKKIMSCGQDILSKMGQYPVINLSLKSAAQADFYTSILKLRDEIVREFIRHNYVEQSEEIDENVRNIFVDLKKGPADWTEKEKTLKTKEEKDESIKTEAGRYSTSIRTLSEVLKAYYKKNVIILIDEYDVPLENAYRLGFYDEMIGFVRSLFESALKTNNSLELAVITGCLRISKESIFTGLNNLAMNSIRAVNFGEYFGFTQAETDELLKDYNLYDDADLVRDWYDGYLFGNSEVYNPWSVTKYVYDHVLDPSRLPEAYWSNTSSNSIIKDMIENADESVKVNLDTLVSGGNVEKVVHEDITYGDIYDNEDNLWNFLYFTGYMKKVSERLRDDNIYMTLTIPNKEVRSIYKNQIKQWFENRIKEIDYTKFYDAIIKKNSKGIEDFLSGLLSKSISYFDSEESFYHGFFLSLLYWMPGYTPKSNREEGNGRTDIVLYPKRPRDPAYIFELKIRKKFSEMEDGLEEALNQIVEKKYVEGILDDGYIGAVSYGICFCKKSCLVGILDK